MTAPTQATAREAVERKHAELIDTLRGYSVLAAPGALAQQLSWAADVITELVADMRDDLRDRKEADEMLRQIGATLRNQTEFTGSYSEIVVKILSALAAKQEELDKMRAESKKLLVVLKEGRRAIGDHHAPDDCYATGPMIGDPIRDLVECPACSFIGMFDSLIARAALSPSQQGERHG